MGRPQPESVGRSTWPQPESVQRRNLAAAGIRAAQKPWAVPGNRPVRAGSI